MGFSRFRAEGMLFFVALIALACASSNVEKELDLSRRLFLETVKRSTPSSYISHARALNLPVMIKTYLSNDCSGEVVGVSAMTLPINVSECPYGSGGACSGPFLGSSGFVSCLPGTVQEALVDFPAGFSVTVQYAVDSNCTGDAVAAFSYKSNVCVNGVLRSCLNHTSERCTDYDCSGDCYSTGSTTKGCINGRIGAYCT